MVCLISLSDYYIGLDAGSHVPAGEQNFCCWRTFLQVKGCTVQVHLLNKLSNIFLVKSLETFPFSARKSRVKRVRESLESSLKRRIELIESYARVCY